MLVFPSTGDEPSPPLCVEKAQVFPCKFQPTKPFLLTFAWKVIRLDSRKDGKPMRTFIYILLSCLWTLVARSQATLTFVGRVPDVQITGTSGQTYRVDYINVYGPTNAWVQLTTVTLTNSLQHYLDFSAIGKPPRLYRAVQIP